jgi:hypothetical protein
LVELTWYDVPPHPTSSFFTFDQSGLGQDACVMGDCGLTLSEWALERTTAYFRLRRDQRKHSQPHRVRKSAEDRGGLLRLGVGKFAFAEGTAATHGRVIKRGNRY